MVKTFISLIFRDGFFHLSKLDYRRLISSREFRNFFDSTYTDAAGCVIHLRRSSSLSHRGWNSFEKINFIIARFVLLRNLLINLDDCEHIILSGQVIKFFTRKFV